MSQITEIQLLTTQSDLTKLSLKCPFDSGSLPEAVWLRHLLAEIMNQRGSGTAKMTTSANGSEYVMIDKQAIRTITITLNPVHEFNFDGGVHAAVVGEVIYVNGATATEHATIKEVIVTSGTWAATAAGLMRVHSATNAFVANLEDNEVIQDSGTTKIADVVGSIIR